MRSNLLRNVYADLLSNVLGHVPTDDELEKSFQQANEQAALACLSETCHHGGDCVLRSIQNFTTTIQGLGEWTDVFASDFERCNDCGALMMYDWTCDRYVSLDPHSASCFQAAMVLTEKEQ